MARKSTTHMSVLGELTLRDSGYKGFPTSVERLSDWLGLDEAAVRDAVVKLIAKGWAVMAEDGGVAPTMAGHDAFYAHACKF